MIVILNLALVLIFVGVVSTRYWVTPSRLSVVKGLLVNAVKGPKLLSYHPLFFSLFYALLVLNLFSNIPLSSGSTLYYFVTFLMSGVI